MKKADFISRENTRYLSSTAAEALEEGKGNRAIGGDGGGIKPDNIYLINGIEFRTQFFEPDDYDTEEHNGKEWGDLTSEEQAEIGTKREWFAFTTDNGDLSFSAVLGIKDMFTEDFWKEAEKSNDFKVENILRTDLRTPKSFIANDCKMSGKDKDGKDLEQSLLGKKVRCVATLERVVKTNSGREFKQKVRAFVWA